MKFNTDTISSCTLFSGLDSEQRQQINGIAVKKIFQKGETVFFEGDSGNGFFLIIDGQIKIVKVSPDGKEKILNIFGSGETFGEVPVFSAGAFPASAQSIGRSRVLYFPKDDFVALISANPSMALNMMAVLSKRLREFTVQIEQLSMKDVSARLAAYLLYLSNEAGSDHDTVHLPISKRHLSSLLGTIPETLSRIFAKMTESNIVHIHGPHVRIRDREQLKNLAVLGKIIME
ncbi:MAG: Crp/Fnr family transcriptional regulator [Desulfobacterales bacterium]|nr:Crp/Fnr family transcriptional regulator [Desulfobacterales bacterium]MDD4072553.1 Crp/Fnr family transcriptional regulator [Desulfobacterales bacterium]MDD4393822.1 Crp/Fnr family transcriptional regulator [Desulfobacterales bacterium]